MKTSSSAQRKLALQPHLVLVSSAVQSDGQCSASQSFTLHAALRFDISATLVNAASNTSSSAQRYVVLQPHLVLVSLAVLVFASLCIPSMYGTRMCAVVVRCTAPSYRVFAFDSNRGRAMAEIRFKTTRCEARGTASSCLSSRRKAEGGTSVAFQETYNSKTRTRKNVSAHSGSDFR